MAKQLFNSTEKSNFILNLTEEQYSKLASYGLLAACFSVSLFTAIPVIVGKSMYELSAAGLAVAGVICMILALISVIKKYVKNKLVFPVCAFGAILLWSVVSLINSYDVLVSLYGYSGRGEGVLAILFYFSFFVTSASIKREKAAETLVYGIVGAGLLNAVIGIVQVFTGAISTYKFISLDIQANAASGFSQSPLFLAMLLTLSLIAALVGFSGTDDKKKKIFFIVSSCIFSFVMMFTYSFIGICGIILSVAALIISVIVLKAPKIKLVAVLSTIVPAVLSVVIVNAGLIGNISKYRLYDGRILWWADSYSRISASGQPDSKSVDIDDTYDVYYKLNSRTMNIIERMPLTGTGPDQLVFPQIYDIPDEDENIIEITDIVILNTGTFDRTYNEYLYTAATRGIPSLIAFAAVLVSVCLIGFKNVKKSRSWVQICLFMMTSAGILLFFIGCGSTAFSPLFWSAAGASCADFLSGKSDNK